MKNHKNQKLLEMLDKLPDQLSEKLQTRIDEVMHDVEVELTRHIKYQNLQYQSIDTATQVTVVLKPYKHEKWNDVKDFTDPLLFTVKPPVNFFEFIQKLDAPLRAWFKKSAINRATFASYPFDTLIWFIPQIRYYEADYWRDFIDYLETAKKQKESEKAIPMEGVHLADLQILR